MVEGCQRAVPEVGMLDRGPFNVLMLQSTGGNILEGHRP